MQTLAVYGTLRKGEYNHDLIDGEMISTGTLVGWRMLTNGSFPNVEMHSGSSIVVEVYEISDEAAEKIDKLEGYPHFYDKTLVVCEGVVAYMYLCRNEMFDRFDNTVVIDSGDWMEKHEESYENKTKNVA